ncbi:MAG: fibronectin type III-like domain-contianing protein, partial [Phenylobacterium sp.]|nr:fibronectin type III-like domain-contianing protein [Phenylobacterium sp.]
FTRVTLAPGEQKTLRLHIPLDALRQWDPATREWVFFPGPYKVCLQTRQGELIEQGLTLAPAA